MEKITPVMLAEIFNNLDSINICLNDFIKYIKYSGNPINFIENASLSGSLSVIKVIHNDDENICSSNLMNFAAAKGHLDIIKWLKENCKKIYSYDAIMDIAAINGHLDIIKELHADEKNNCSNNLINFAAAKGHLDIVKWLHKNCTTDCTTNAMDFAAANGHLNIVKWLYENRTEGCTQIAFDLAMINGHVDVILFLQKINEYEKSQIKN
jgi:hypothetical protein